MITLQNWRTRMSEDMRLHDYRDRTHDGYLLAARQFIDHVAREPETFTDEDVRQYILFLREEKKRSPSTINIAIHALRFFFTHTMQRDWSLFDLLRVKRPQRLPVVLSTIEVRSVLGAIRHPVRRTALTTIYALGLRIGEGLSLEPGNIDAARRLVWIRNGKGAIDRSVPLPRPLLARLRHYWKHERPASPTKFLFAPEGSRAPLHETTLQKTVTAARRDVRIEKHATPHSFRHSYATHLLEAGISLRTIQQILGHKSLRTTEIYMHVTQPGTERLLQVLDRLMDDL